MEIIDNFQVAASPDMVWDMFQDVPALVSCIPGVELTDQLGTDSYAGRMNIRLGPMKPSFEGEAHVERDLRTRSGTITAKGKDTKGGSRADATIRFSVHPTDGGARVELVSTVNLMGQLAQFGRTNLLQDVSAQMTSEFANCLAAKMAAPTQEAADAVHSAELSAFATLLAVVQLRVRRLMKRAGQWLIAHSTER